MGFKFPSSNSRKMKVPSMGSSGSGQNALMQFMLAQMMRDKAPEDIAAIQKQVGGFKPGAKLNISNRGAEIQQPLNVDFTLDESRAIGQGDAFNAHVKFFEDAMNTMPHNEFVDKFKKASMHFPGADRGQIFGFPTTFGDSKSQLIKFALQDMSDRILRLRSGAQINPQEANRLMALLPTWEDVSDPSDTNFEVVRTKLYQFNSDVNNIKNILQQGGNYKSDLWEGLNTTNPTVLQHPAYSGYLKSRKSTQPGNDDPLGVYSNG